MENHAVVRVGAEIPRVKDCPDDELTYGPVVVVCCAPKTGLASY